MSNLSEHSSEFLASIVVCYRVLKTNKELSKEAMSILARRKEDGDDFDYISYINNKVKEMPEPTIGADKIETFKNILKNVKSTTF